MRITQVDESAVARAKRHQLRRPDLQGMRAVAVLAVFADHLFNWPSGGFAGVDVFFVLSGFFITGLLIRERTTTHRISFRDFYTRRVKRILPSALLVLVAAVLGAYILFPPVRAKSTLIDSLYAAVFGANFRFQAVGADYFQQGLPPSPVQHYWSLSIEEQFYFVWPLLLAALFLITRRRRRDKVRLRQWGLFGGMAVMVATSFAWAMYQSGSDSNAAYFSTFTRLWELGVGALVAIGGSWLTRIPSAIRPIAAYLGLVGVVASLFAIDSSTRWPGPWTALPVLSTALVVASFHGTQVRGMTVLTNPVARWFGDTSYTLYLWHWPVIVLLLAVFPKGPLFYGTALTLALALTAATYRFYEDPIRRSNWLIDNSAPVGRRIPQITRRVWAAAGCLAVAAVVLSILSIRYDDRVASVAQELQHATQDSIDSPNLAPQADPCFGAAALATPGCPLRTSAKPLRPSIDWFTEDTRIETKGCYRIDDRPLKSCTYGYVGGDATRIALVGDSHAEQIVTALLPGLVANKWQLTTYVGIGCQWKSPPLEKCVGSEVIESDLLARPFDLVLTTASRQAEGTADDYAKAWVPVAAAGSRIVVIADSPGVDADSLACLTRLSLDGDQTGECGTSKDEAFTQPDRLVAATKLVPGAEVIDLTASYCTYDRCPSVVGDVIVYRDTMGHITDTYAATLAPSMSDAIRRVLGA